MSDTYMDGALPEETIHSTPTDPLSILVSSPDAHVPVTDNSKPEPEPLSKERESAMLRSIEEIFQFDEDPTKEDEEMADDEDEEEVVDLEDLGRRTEKLKAVMPALAQLWWAGSEQFDIATEKLADGSRNYQWRLPMGESGILNFFLEMLSSQDLRHPLKIHTLRLIGNSCADTDENRARVVASPAYLPSIMLHLKDPSLLPFAIPVLFNICIDYESAQQQASGLYLTKELVDVISGPMLKDAKAFLGYVCKLLGLMATQRNEPNLAPENTAIILLKIAADRESPVDMEDFIALVYTAVAYLQYEKFQKALVVQGALDTTLAVLVDSYTRFDSHPSIGVSTEQEDANALTQMRSSLNQVLSDISALDEFKVAYPVFSPFSASLRRWLLSPQLQLQVCACIMLGNLARSDQSCIEFVHTSQVHKPLIAIITDATDSQLLHAALGFLKNLALPLSNKEPLGEAGLLEILPRLWTLDTLPQIQFSSISLARQLTIGTFENVRRIVKRLSDDPDSPANSRTKLSVLLAIFERTDAEPTKMEIARLTTSLCRVFNTYTGRSPEELEKSRIKFFARHPDIGRPLSFMVSQTKWPVVRSEGWFVFALMARYPEGAKIISDILHDVGVMDPLVEMLTGKSLLVEPIPEPSSLSPTSPPSVSSPHPQALEMARLDRENALVLISELLKNNKDMAVMRRAMLEDLLKGGGELVMSYRERKETLNEFTQRSGRERTKGWSVGEIAEQSVDGLS